MIVRCLTIQEIKKIYDGKKINENLREALTPECDYVVISIETIIEYNKDPARSFRYWIVNDQDCLIPYDAYNFKIIDSYFPSSWVMDLNKRGIEISHPKWAQYGYVEDYFDNRDVAKEYDKIVKIIFNESIDVALQNGKKLNLALKKNYRISEMLLVANQILHGKIPIGRCSNLSGLLWKEDMDTNEDFFVFKRFSKERDQVWPPLERVLQRLPKAELQEIEIKVKELEKKYKDEIFEACEKLIKLLNGINNIQKRDGLS